MNEAINTALNGALLALSAGIWFFVGKYVWHLRRARRLSREALR